MAMKTRSGSSRLESKGLKSKFINTSSNPLVIDDEQTPEKSADLRSSKRDENEQPRKQREKKALIAKESSSKKNDRDAYKNSELHGIPKKKQKVTIDITESAPKKASVTSNLTLERKSKRKNDVESIQLGVKPTIDITDSAPKEASVTSNLTLEKRCKRKNDVASIQLGVKPTTSNQENVRKNKKETKKDKKLKGLMDETVQKEEDVEEKVKKDDIKEMPRLNSRMSPKSLFEVMQSFTDGQRDLVKGMGFGSFLQMRLNEIPAGKLAHYLVSHFKPINMSIKLRNGSIKITADTVHDMMGLPKGGVKIDDLQDCPDDDTIYNEWKSQFPNGKYNNVNYVKMIRKSRLADDIFKLNFLTLFINTFCESELSGSKNIKYVRKLARSERISNIDWCGYMLDCLERTKYKWKPNKLVYFSGPLTLLMLTYVDRVEYEGIQIPRCRPFIKAVDSEDFRIIEEIEIEIGHFGRGKVRDETFVVKEGIYANVHREYKTLQDSISMIEQTILDGLEMYPNDEVLNEWKKKTLTMLSGSRLVDYRIARSSTLNVERDIGISSEYVNRLSDTDLGGNSKMKNKTPEKEEVIASAAISSKSELNLWFASKIRTPESIKKVYSPYELSPGYLAEVDEIEKSFGKNQVAVSITMPSFDLGVTNLMDEYGSYTENEGELGMGQFEGQKKLQKQLSVEDKNCSTSGQAVVIYSTPTEYNNMQKQNAEGEVAKGVVEGDLNVGEKSSFNTPKATFVISSPPTADTQVAKEVFEGKENEVHNNVPAAIIHQNAEGEVAKGVVEGDLNVGEKSSFNTPKATFVISSPPTADTQVANGVVEGKENEVHNNVPAAIIHQNAEGEVAKGVVEGDLNVGEKSSFNTPKATFVISSPPTADTQVANGVVEGKENEVHNNVPAAFIQQSENPKETSTSVVKDSAIDDDKRKGKRKVKASRSLCSPYIKRIVPLSEKTTPDEQLVAQAICGSRQDNEETIWQSEQGYEMLLGATKTLWKDIEVDQTVIDCWSHLLNRLEDYKSESSKSRVFLPTNILSEAMIDEGKPETIQYDTFLIEMNRAIDKISYKANLENVDLVFFPIVDGKNYYLLVFNLKSSEYYIFDNKKMDGTLESRYGKKPKIIQSLFCTYMENVGHKGVKELANKAPDLVKMKWQTSKMNKDGGIFLMRHMECYMGENVKNWTCEFSKESKAQEANLLRLRFKYMSKLMLCEFNVLKEQLDAEVHEFAKHPREQRGQMIAEGLKDIKT